MAARKGKSVNKVQPLFAQPVSDNIFSVRSAKLTEVLRSDDDSLDRACLDFSRLEPPPIHPGLDLEWRNMKCRRQGVLREAVPAHGRTGTHTIERMPDRTPRSPEDCGYFVDWMQIDQLLQSLSFGLRPPPLSALGTNPHAPHKFPTRRSRIS